MEAGTEVNASSLGPQIFDEQDTEHFGQPSFNEVLLEVIH